MARGEQGEEVPAQDAPQASPQKKIRYPLHLTADSRVKRKPPSSFQDGGFFMLSGWGIKSNTGQR
jgi:hypothetical protein